MKETMRVTVPVPEIDSSSFSTTAASSAAPTTRNAQAATGANHIATSAVSDHSGRGRSARRAS